MNKKRAQPLHIMGRRSKAMLEIIALSIKVDGIERRYDLVKEQFPLNIKKQILMDIELLGREMVSDHPYYIDNFYYFDDEETAVQYDYNDYIENYNGGIEELIDFDDPFWVEEIY